MFGLFSSADPRTRPGRRDIAYMSLCFEEERVADERIYGEGVERRDGQARVTDGSRAGRTRVVDGSRAGRPDVTDGSRAGRPDVDAVRRSARHGLAAGHRKEQPGSDRSTKTAIAPCAPVDAEKAALRRLVLARRDILDPCARARKSARICVALAREILDGETAGSSGGAAASAPLSHEATVGATAAAHGERCPAVVGVAPTDHPTAVGVAPTGHRPTVATTAHTGHRPTVAVYAAFGSEADPSAFAQAAEQAGWRVVYPCMLPRPKAAVAEDVHAGEDRDGNGPIPAAPSASQRMAMRAVTWTDRARCPFLVHPTRAFAKDEVDAERYPLVPARELDAIVVPLVAFDARGMRLGYGGGCYDRYLPTLSAACKILGIAFDEQQVEAVPVNSYDLPLPRIITA